LVNVKPEGLNGEWGRENSWSPVWGD